MAGPAKYILGEGVFSIGDVDIALCRGGGQFTVTPEFRRVNADGDRGPVKGRIRKVGAEARLIMRALEIIPENLPKLYAATKVETDSETDATVFTGKPDVEETDYNTVTWTGRTSDGQAVVITLENAINLEALDWTMAEKDEVVPQVTYTGTYAEGNQEVEPWKVEFADAI